MAHQMKNLCGFSVFHCVEGAFGASSGGTPKMKNGAPRDELKNGRGCGWAVPNHRGAIPQWPFGGGHVVCPHKELRKPAREIFAL